MSTVARSAAVLGVTIVAGGAGAVVRAVIAQRAPRLGIHAANVAGTVALALVLRAQGAGVVGTEAVLILGVGFAGALTTFSGWVALATERSRLVGIPRAATLDVALPMLLATVATIVVFASG